MMLHQATCKSGWVLATFLVFAASVASGLQPEQPGTSSLHSYSPVPVIFDHDGGVDDFITLLLLLSQPHKVNLLGITILDGDCHSAIALNTTLKLLHLLGHSNIPVAVSTLPAANPFPAVYRAQGLILDVLPVLNQHKPAHIAALKQRQVVQESGQEYLAQLLLQQEQPVTVIATGPLSNVAYALDRYPQVAAKIERVWWMGGALRVRGNVYEPHSDGSAEWNAFWDPAALAVIWNSSLHLTLVPLDGTNKVPITADFVYSFGPQAHHLYSLLAGTFYAPVVNWMFSTPKEPYFAWDALTAACLLDTKLCNVEEQLETAAVLSGPSQGAIVLTQQQQQQQQQTQQVAVKQGPVQHPPLLTPGSLAVSGRLSASKLVSAVMDVDPHRFQQFMLSSMRQ